MKKILILVQAALFALVLLCGPSAYADDDQYAPGDGLEQGGEALFTPEELDDLLAPIALYPDPLLAQILPAATFVDQIDLAERYVRQYGKAARVDDQPWDVSVKAVAHYPDLLFMMDQKYDWTVSLGQAFINQQQDVMDAIQRLRAEAQEAGNLGSTPQQEVVDQGGYISIEPAEPETIYVPQYDPQVVYVERAPAYGFITFGIGFSIGAWLDRDCDWRGRRVYYHGWQGRGWIDRTRPYIHDRRNIYINNRVSVINVNRRVIQHDTSSFRQELRRDVRYRRQQAPLPAVRPGENQPTGRGAGRVQGVRPLPTVAPPATQPVKTVIHPVQRPANEPLYRGRVLQGPQPAARSGYGGYGSNRDAETYRERGQASRGNMGQPGRQLSPPVQSQRPAPAQRPAASQGHPQAPRPASQPAMRPAAPAGRGGGQERQHR